MVAFFKSRSGSSEAEKGRFLGPLEARVMSIVWTQGECSVRDVTARIERSLAYTTVMTTLDRLYKKGFLERRKVERAFLYSSRLPRGDWERTLAGEWVTRFLSGPPPSRERLLSFLVDAVGQQDESLLAELERKIRRKRKELNQRSAP